MAAPVVKNQLSSMYFRSSRLVAAVPPECLLLVQLVVPPQAPARSPSLRSSISGVHVGHTPVHVGDGVGDGDAVSVGDGDIVDDGVGDIVGVGDGVTGGGGVIVIDMDGDGVGVSDGEGVGEAVSVGVIGGNVGDAVDEAVGVGEGVGGGGSESDVTNLSNI